MQNDPPFRVSPLPKPVRKGDRRKMRAVSAARAVELAFERAASRGGLDAVLLVDTAGMLVAKTRGGPDLGMLAAVVPLVGRGQVSATVKRRGEMRELTVRPVQIGSEVMYLGALGGAYGDRLREVGTSAAAARRILAA
jgi:hypothetical protein